MKPKLFIFILGLIVGLLVALAVPPLIQKWLPAGLRGSESATTGVVVAKRLENDRLLLTIESPDGAVLATFKQRVPEIDLLIETGDQVTLGITSYEPFVEDPKILGVKKSKEGEIGPSKGEIAEPKTQPGSDSEAGSGAAAESPDEPTAGSDDVTLPPMGPPLADEPQSPPPGSDRGKGGSGRS